MVAEPERDLADVLAAYRITKNVRGNIVGATADALRDAILDDVLEPGAWLREVVLAEALGVSRTPVREALARLEEEGLVVRERGAGARVTQVSLEDMSVVYQVRGSLESLAARFVAARISAPQLEAFEQLQDEMRRAAQAGDSHAFSNANVGFHRQLSLAAGNAYLSRLLSTVEIGLRRFGARTFTPERMAAVVEEHQQIVRAFAAQDPDAAADAASRHAASARESTVERLIADMR
ncbi:GntR family transcriptional regulator [Microbacterium sp. Marseille-Q6965]|uniref:GntR family transcriptional regulator n=1 Tax=Microbacterium sp. Marseille-Q6965 TaxID=2965072 RepID=UPI0021B77495|nr:GntR family transcriptional regulator [Microbacterium sp. Marseille-Q6965]